MDISVSKHNAQKNGGQGVEDASVDNAPARSAFNLNFLSRSAVEVSMAAGRRSSESESSVDSESEDKDELLFVEKGNDRLKVSADLEEQNIDNSEERICCTTISDEQYARGSSSISKFVGVLSNWGKSVERVDPFLQSFEAKHGFPRIFFETGQKKDAKHKEALSKKVGRDFNSFCLNTDKLLFHYGARFFSLTEQEATEFVSTIAICANDLDRIFETLYGNASFDNREEAFLSFCDETIRHYIQYAFQDVSRSYRQELLQSFFGMGFEVFISTIKDVFEKSALECFVNSKTERAIRFKLLDNKHPLWSIPSRIELNDLREGKDYFIDRLVNALMPISKNQEAKQSLINKDENLTLGQIFDRDWLGLPIIKLFASAVYGGGTCYHGDPSKFRGAALTRDFKIIKDWGLDGISFEGVIPEKDKNLLIKFCDEVRRHICIRYFQAEERQNRPIHGWLTLYAQKGDEFVYNGLILPMVMYHLKFLQNARIVVGGVSNEEDFFDKIIVLLVDHYLDHDLANQFKANRSTLARSSRADESLAQ